jgi:hypothetical protein
LRSVVASFLESLREQLVCNETRLREPIHSTNDSDMYPPILSRPYLSMMS